MFDQAEWMCEVVKKIWVILSNQCSRLLSQVSFSLTLKLIGPQP